MANPFFNVSAVALAAGIAVAGIASADAAPVFEPVPPTVRSDVVQVQVDAKVRRDRLHRDSRDWKKRHHHRDRREQARNHDGRYDLYRPKSTPKYSHDAYGNFHIEDGDRRWRRHAWDGDDWNGRDGKKKRKHRRLYTSSYQQPSEALRNILTAVPD